MLNGLVIYFVHIDAITILERLKQNNKKIGILYDISTPGSPATILFFITISKQ